MTLLPQFSFSQLLCFLQIERDVLEKVVLQRCLCCLIIPPASNTLKFSGRPSPIYFGCHPPIIDFEKMNKQKGVEKALVFITIYFH